MSHNIKSAAIVGTDAVRVDVEVMTTGTFPSFDTIGLPEQSVRETRVRVRSAIRESGMFLPDRRIIVNLTPAGLRKDGTHFDLPMALGILVHQGQIEAGALDDWIVFGELSLLGEIRPVRGSLAIAELARNMGLRGVICAMANAAEASCVDGIEVRGASFLGDVVENLKTGAWQPFTPLMGHDAWPPGRMPCWSDVRGQEDAKRAIKIAAAGGHNILLTGTPGCGRTMLARRLPTILPPLTKEEAFTTTKIHSVAGLLPRGGGLLTHRPFRAPHHTASTVSLVGGGAMPRPGELSVAHNGVFFMDELPEFSKSAIEATVTGVLYKQVVLDRMNTHVVFPTNVMFVAAQNPCPCGWEGSNFHPCSCTQQAVTRYRDRAQAAMGVFDIKATMKPVAPQQLHGLPPGETSEVVRARVVAARERQALRYGAGNTNASLLMESVMQKFPLTPKLYNKLNNAMIERGYGMSILACNSTWRVAATIADLDGVDTITEDHLDEAIALAGRRYHDA